MTTQPTTDLSWKTVLAAQIPPHLAEEIDHFETQMVLRKQNVLLERGTWNVERECQFQALK